MRLRICFTIDSVPFTASVIAGMTSLGGSESACLGLARALQARGHDVHIFVSQLTTDAPGVDQYGVGWHAIGQLAGWSTLMDWDVAIALRQPQFLQHAPAKLRVLWGQDLMANQAMHLYQMSLAWTYDAVAYVSDFHRHQWEAISPELAPLGWVTKNGHDARLAAEARAAAVKKPHQIIHVSRPERGLAPLLTMWPMLKAKYPKATLALCRYSSMYDTAGWGAICAEFDKAVGQMNQEVGGISWLGELGKPALYKAIAESAVMWYPGVSTFGETSCIAAIEAQACGTPFVGSYKGALPETVPSGILIPGIAESDEAYQSAAIAAVIDMLDGCAKQQFAYRQRVNDGLRHVQGYSYEAVAAEWEAFILQSFEARYAREKAGILRRLKHEDDYVTARIVAEELGDVAELADCDSVLTGEVAPEDYARHALDPLLELGDTRLNTVVKMFEGCQRVLDVACGSGAYPVALALADPTRHVVAVDYAAGNIASGRHAAEVKGVADRITWAEGSAWDMANQRPSEWLAGALQTDAGTFDGLWCGEFLEHVVDCSGLVRTLDRLVTPGGRVAYSVPQGPLHSIATRHMETHRSHVHHFRPADLAAIFGQKAEYRAVVMPWLQGGARGEALGNWILSYRRGTTDDTGMRPLDRRRLLRPYARLTAGIITNDALDLRRCLDAIWPVVDEIVIGDCGARADDLAAIVAEFPRKTRVIHVGPVPDLHGGFSEARNRVLAEASGEWFLWIDSDEVLCGARDLGKYLDGPTFQGYVITQNHLHLDASMTRDTPVRLFRKRPEIKFYGCVHEQPQWKDANGEIQPALQVADVQIAHTGYLYEGIRREKCLTRNLPLLIRDQQVFPERELGKVLVLRDYANLALWARERSGGKLTDEIKTYQGKVIGLFEENFFDPMNKYHGIARPFYEAALKDVAGALQVEVAITGGLAPDGLNGTKGVPERIWVRKPEHLRTLLAGRVEAMLKPLESTAPDIDVEPWPPAVAVVPEREAVSA